MSGYPGLLDLTDVPVLVVGGGEVAARKVEGLLAGGGTPDVLAPEVTDVMAGLLATFGLVHRRARFADGDTEGYRIVFAATDDREVNAHIAGEALQRGIWVNVADDPEASSFHVPAVLRQGDAVVAASTGGAAPLLAAALRNRLAEVVTPGLGRTVARLHSLREEVHARWPDDAQRRRSFWRSLVNEEFLDEAIAGSDAAVEARIEVCLSRS